MSQLTLAEYIQAANRGVMNRIIPSGFFAKQTYLSQAQVFNATYGKMVWDALNNQTKFWNCLEKVPWGPTVGWRLRSDRGAGRSRPVTETGAIPTPNRSTYQAVQSAPRMIVTDFGVTILNQFMGGLEGGIGDVMAQEQSGAGRDHVKELNLELLLGSHTIASDADTVAQGEYFRQGDVVYDTNDNESGAGDTLTDVTGDDLTGLSSADGRIVYIKSRAGLTSLDDIVEEDGRTIAGVAINSARGVGVYNINSTSDRAPGTWSAASVVLDNDGTIRDLTLTLLDQAIRNIRQNGGDPDLILMNYDQFDRLNALMQVQQRYSGEGEFTVKLGDESTFPGYKTGLNCATYRGIPILVDNDVRFGVNADDSDQGSYVYVLDTRFLKIAIANQTNYIENRDPFQANAMVIRGLYWTMAELRSTRLDVHSKICDLRA